MTSNVIHVIRLYSFALIKNGLFEFKFDENLKTLLCAVFKSLKYARIALEGNIGLKVIYKVAFWLKG